MSFHTLIHAALLLHLFLPPSAHSQKRQTPKVDSAHVRGLIRIVVPWWRGAVWLARGVCRHEACQRAFKEPGLRKRKQMAAGITPLMDCTCYPRAPLPQLPFNQCPENPLGSFEVEECLNDGLVHAASHHKFPADSCATLPISLTHFHKQTSTIHVYGSLHPIVAVHRTSDWQWAKKIRGEEQQQEEENNKLEI